VLGLPSTHGTADGEPPNSIALKGTFGEDVLRRVVFDAFMGHYAMDRSAVSRILVGPFGLHAFGGAMLFLFLVFLWVFNFTTFF
jgi:hypothetical protein